MKNIEKAVMWRSIFKVPVNGTELGLQGALGQTGHVKINIIDGGDLINGSNLLVKEKLSKVLKSCLLGLAMPHNGPLVWAVSVGGAVRRYESRYFSREIIPAARQVWRAFCRHGTSFIECWSDRGTILISGRVFFPVDEVAKGHWRSIAV